MDSWLQAFRKQSLARQLLTQLSVLVTLLLLSLAGIAYFLIARLAEQTVPPILQRSVALQAAEQGRGFMQAQDSVKRLAREWLHRIEQPSDAEIDRRFQRLFERQSDGLWRLKPEHIDTQRAPTFYLQHGASGPDASVRRRAVIGYQLLAEQGPALVPPYFSAYTDFVEKGLMVFSPGIDWGKGATASTDNFSYPTMRGSDPTRNPGREVFWTPVYFDTEAKAWMVSVIQPLDWRGRWVGTWGHDITIDDMLKQISEAQAPLDAVSMILSRDGHVIAHPALRERIAAAQGQLSLQELQDPLLSEAMTLIQQAAPGTQQARSRDGRYHLVWAPIPGPGWWSVQVLPQSAIDALLEQLVATMLVLGVLILSATLWLLRGVIRHRLQQPLSAVTASTAALAERVLQGEEPKALPPQSSRDLNRLSQAFDTMAAKLAGHRRQEQAALQALEQEVAERRQAEEEVRVLNLSLEARVRERGLALEQAQEELVQRETLASLGSLVAGVSHELNTPIGNALIATDTATEALGQIQAMLAGGSVRRGELLSAVDLAHQSLDLALGNIRRSASLLQDFKQVAMDRSSLQRRRFKLRQVTEEVVHLLHFYLKTGAHEVLIDLPDELSLDSYPGPFGQVLTNLVQNAAVHGFEEQQAGRIEIRLQDATAERVLISVSDNGRGIPAEHLDQVFKPFFTTRFGKGGSGLGLHLVYNMVRNVLGGEISLQSTLGQGTRFVLSLPRTAPQDSKA